VLTPSSRLSDDLYRLYLAGMAWLFLPFYAEVLSIVLPSAWAQFAEAFDVIVVVVIGAGLWSGARGGPLMVTRPVILHELGSPVSRRRLLLPWLIRQAAAWAIAAAVMATVVSVLADAAVFTYESVVPPSVAALLAAWAAVFLAVSTMVATHQPELRVRLGAGVLVMVAIVVVAVAVGVSMRTWAGLGVVGAVAVASTLLGAAVVPFAPIEPMWRRATAVESMRSSLQQLQFQRAVLDLRHATEQPPFGTERYLAWNRLPLGLWRHIAGVQHTPGWHLARLVVLTGALAALFWLGDLSQGVVALAMSGCALFIGIELSGAVAATADQMTFAVHYPRGSGVILRGQVLTAALIAAGLGLIAAVGQISNAPRSVVGVLVLCAMGAFGGSVQSRLGSPDVAALLSKYGPKMLSNVLWARALLGPLMLLATTILVYHQFFSAAPLAAPLDYLIGALMLTAFALSSYPLERSLGAGT